MGMYYNNLTAFVFQADHCEVEMGILQEQVLNNISKLVKDYLCFSVTGLIVLFVYIDKALNDNINHVHSAD